MVYFLVLAMLGLSPAAWATYAESAIFAFDTRDSNSTHYGESNVFAFNTRAIDGLSGGRASGGFVLDTRSLFFTGLEILAPANVSGGTGVDLTAMAHFSNGPSEDVSDRAAWSVTGGSPGTHMEGRKLVTGYSATPVAATVRANYQRGSQLTGQRIVTIGPAQKVVFSQLTRPVGVTSGATISWPLAATVTVSGGVPLYGAQWRWKGQTLPTQDQLGLSTTVTGGPSSGQLDVTITDAQGKTGTASVFLNLNKPPTANEPLPTVTASDGGIGTLYDGDGISGVFLDPAKKTNGFVVIVHGWNGRVAPGGWVTSMASAIRAQLGASATPNILLYDWEDAADPSKYYGDDDAHEEVEAMAREIAMHTFFVNPVLGVGLFGTPFAYGTLAVGVQFLTDIFVLRPAGDRQGRALKKWIKDRLGTGIDPNAKIHFIGHNAGGFVVAECAARLLAERAFANLVVTTLDTPMLRPEHITGVIEHGGRFERYLSQYGHFVNPLVEYPLDRRAYYPSLIGNRQQTSPIGNLITIPVIDGDANYRISRVSSTGTYTGVTAFHSEAHAWYIQTIAQPNQ